MKNRRLSRRVSFDSPYLFDKNDVKMYKLLKRRGMIYIFPILFAVNVSIIVK